MAYRYPESIEDQVWALEATQKASSDLDEAAPGLLRTALSSVRSACTTDGRSLRFGIWDAVRLWQSEPTEANAAEVKARRTDAEARLTDAILSLQVYADAMDIQARKARKAAGIARGIKRKLEGYMDAKECSEKRAVERFEVHGKQREVRYEQDLTRLLEYIETGKWTNPAQQAFPTEARAPEPASAPPPPARPVSAARG